MTAFAFGQGLPIAVPEKVGVSAERLERIRPVMQGYVDKGNLPGLLTAVARHGKIVHFETIGMRDVENRKPIETDTISGTIFWIDPEKELIGLLMTQISDVSSSHDQFKVLTYQALFE